MIISATLFWNGNVMAKVHWLSDNHSTVKAGPMDPQQKSWLLQQMQRLWWSPWVRQKCNCFDARTFAFEPTDGSFAKKLVAFYITANTKCRTLGTGFRNPMPGSRIVDPTGIAACLTTFLDRRLFLTLGRSLISFLPTSTQPPRSEAQSLLRIQWVLNASDPWSTKIAGNPWISDYWKLGVCQGLFAACS